MKYQLTRLAIAALAAFLTSMAAACYVSVREINAGYENVALPAVTILAYHLAQWFIGIPVALFILGAILIRRGREPAAVIVRDVTWAFALSWPLLVIAACEISNMLIGVRLR